MASNKNKSKEKAKRKVTLSNKSLCKLRKDLNTKSGTKEYISLVSKGKYLCKKCGRVANRKKNLCRGVAI